MVGRYSGPMSRKSATERRADALTAARRLIVEQGIEAASVRNVAAAAGMSAGSLRHIFPSHEDLFVALLEDAETTVGSRIGELIDRSRGGDDTDDVPADGSGCTPTDRRRALALELLLQVEPVGGGDAGGRPTPAGGGTRSDLLAQLAVLTANPGNTRLAEVRRRTGKALDGLCLHVVRELLADTSADPAAVDVQATALELRLILDGTALRVLENPDFGEEQVRKFLAHTLDRLIPPS